MKRRLWCAVLLATAVTVSSCGSIDVRALPQPGNDYRDGYNVVLEFDNVLNLPSAQKS